MKSARIDIPLAVVGCDFRTAATMFRECLVSTRETRARLFQAMRRMDSDAGFVALETCNRVEWVVFTETPSWIAEILLAQMVHTWKQVFPGIEDLPVPAVHIGEDAARHILRVAVGRESLATGEAQIARQLQSALKRAQTEKTSSVILNRLGSAAGRLAKIGYRIGFRSNRRQGIHGLTVRYLDRHFRGKPHGKRVLVVGMGSIGRKTAQAVAERKGFAVTRVNRTLHPGGRDWHTLEELPGLSRNADALVVATGSLTPILDASLVAAGTRSAPLLIMDIGIPRQVHPELRAAPGVCYRNLDHLIELDQEGVDHEMERRLELELNVELEQFRRCCRERGMVHLLDKIHRGRQEAVRNRLGPFLAAHLDGVDKAVRKKVEVAVRRFLQDYADGIHRALHDALEDRLDKK
jgi:glutamyl-tRNA reductase